MNKKVICSVLLAGCITVVAGCSDRPDAGECPGATMGLGACTLECQGECVADNTLESGIECYRCELPNICGREELLEENCEELCTEGVCEYAYSTSRGQRCFNCIDTCSEPHMTATECERSDCNDCAVVGEGLNGNDCYACNDCQLPLLDSYSCISTCSSQEDCEWVKTSPGGQDCYQCTQPEDCTAPLMNYTECSITCNGQCEKSTKNGLCWTCNSVETECEPPSKTIQECHATCHGPNKSCHIIPPVGDEEACAVCTERACDIGYVKTEDCEETCSADHHCKHAYTDGYLNCSECVPNPTEFEHVNPGEMCFDENLQPTPCR